jgi:hypothetical protein
MRNRLAVFFLLLMVCLTIVTPRVLPEMNLAEIVEEESGGSSTQMPVEEIKSHLPFHAYSNKESVSKIFARLCRVKFLHYNEFYVDPHCQEIDTPPPDLA